MNQNVLFINSLFQNSQTATINVSVKDRHTGAKMTLEVYPNGDNTNVLPFRIKLTDGSFTIWNSFEDLDDIQNKFRMFGIE